MNDDPQDVAPDSTMSVDDVRTMDTRGAEGARAPKQTYFFTIPARGKVPERIIATEAIEAWEIIFNRSNWRRHDFRFLGSSNGQTYARVIREGRTVADRLTPEIQKLEAELKKYKEAEQRLLVEEAVDMEGDPSDAVNEANKAKVRRLQGIMERIQGQLTEKQEEFRKATTGVVQKAFDAELAEAKKNPNGWPDENLNIMTPGASPKGRRKILNLIAEATD